MYTNRLIYETSPYLLQHAHNPVDWYAWNDEALQRARAENKPILLSIGYSACHWCHVMERESFENPAIARLMNENFINIKVDREERPDLDQIYMNAVQLMTGHGGWPLTVFLTPDLVPFFGGTYFPPEDRYQMPGFPRVLLGVAQAFREKPDEVAESANNMLAELRRLNVAIESNRTLSVEILDHAFERLARNYDARFGGFGSAPKFPSAANLEFLLRTYIRTKDKTALEMVTQTCRNMAEGGMYDQLGGGFHRYSTDARWLVPHFEKMLYDNAQLAPLYLHVYQITRDEFFKQIAVETLDYVRREMTDASGGFYSTQDADSEGVEGKFFIWAKQEIFDLLNEGDARIFCARYGVTEAGNFEGENILHIARSINEIAKEFDLPPDAVNESLTRSRRTLFEAREKRIKPARDEKILTAWNGLMMQAFAEAAAILGRADYLAAAEENARFIIENLRRDNLLLHVQKDGQAKLNGYLDDYAFIARALIALYEATGETEYLRESLALTETMIAEFWDEEEGGFFYTGKSHERLIVRNKDLFDNATPSGNSVAADALLRLAILTDNEDFRRKATTIFRVLRDAMLRYPNGFGYALSTLDFYLAAPLEIVIIGDENSADARELARTVWQRYLPNSVVAQARENDEAATQLIPLLQSRTMIDRRATAYVCQNRACQQPVNSPSELNAQLDAH
jgi:uncharacterized protein YyaL (SSP411 family)